MEFSCTHRGLNMNEIERMFRIDLQDLCNRYDAIITVSKGKLPYAEIPKHDVYIEVDIPKRDHLEAANFQIRSMHPEEEWK